MKNYRAVFWLFLGTAAALTANLILDAHSPAIRTVRSDSLVPASFDPSSIVIKRSGATQIVLEKGTDWRIVSPFSGSADASAVMKLLDAVVFSEVEDSVSETELVRFGRSYADFIPSPPVLSLELSDGRKKAGVSFGKYTPSSNGVYAVSTGSDKLMVVPSSVYAAAWTEVDAFRQRGLFPFDPESVASFDVKRQSGRLQNFVRDGGTWRSGGTVASSAKIREFVSLFAGARVRDFVWPAGASNGTETVSAPLLSGYGLDSESASTVTFRCTDGRECRFSFGNPAGGKLVYASVRNGMEIVTLDAALKDAVTQNSVGFIDSRLFPMERAEVKSFAIVDGDGTYVLSLDSSGAWRMNSPIVAAADAGMVKRVLDRILKLSVSDVLDSGVTLSVNTGGSPAVVGRESVLGERSFVGFRSKNMLNVEPAEVKRIVVSVKGAGRAVSVVYSPERRLWNVEASAKKGVVNQDAVKELLKTMRPLRASKVVTLRASAAELSRYGLDSPYCTVAVDRVSEGSVRRNILIGNETEGGRFATVGSADAIFVMPEAAVSTLTSELIEE